MSLCLGVTKTVAISSLGLYAGILSTSTILSFNKSTSIILSNLDIINKAQIKQIINNVFQFGNIVGFLSTTFFGLSYFGAPNYWKHPYLLYGMLVSPLSNLYLFYLKRSIENKLRIQSINNNNNNNTVINNDGSKPIQISENFIDSNKSDHSTNESLVDLGQTRSLSPSIQSGIDDILLKNTRSFCNSIALRLLFTTTFSIVGLVQSVIGVYGEGNFI